MWLWGRITGSGALPPAGLLHSNGAVIALSRLARESCFGGRLEELRDRVVLLAVEDQLSAALAMLELDGVAKRMVLCPPGLSADHLAKVRQDAGAQVQVCDARAPRPSGLSINISLTPEPQAVGGKLDRRSSGPTEWILLTSATTGAPKLVQHSLETLTSAFADAPHSPGSIVWSTFYDICRYGGLQIYLRGLFCGSMMLSAPSESVSDFLARAGAIGVTHISGTPSHWRRVLMSGAASRIAPHYVRLSGEIADQGILDALHAAYPAATLAHAYATTEAGLVLEVNDGLAGFASNLIGMPAAGIELKLAAGTLHVRSAGNATRYVGSSSTALRDCDGFVDTGDRVELRQGRYYFKGRSGGVINVGGLKVHPEEVESVINAHPWVRMSLVKARRNPITGAVVAADVVLADDLAGEGARPAVELITNAIIEHCRKTLSPHKVPAMIRIVDALEVSRAGKLVRPNA